MTNGAGFMVDNANSIGYAGVKTGEYLSGRRRLKSLFNDFDPFTPRPIVSHMFGKTAAGVPKRMLWPFDFESCGPSEYLEHVTPEILRCFPYPQLYPFRAGETTARRLRFSHLSREGTIFLCADAEGWENQRTKNEMHMNTSLVPFWLGKESFDWLDQATRCVTAYTQQPATKAAVGASGVHTTPGELPDSEFSANFLTQYNNTVSMRRCLKNAIQGFASFSRGQVQAKISGKGDDSN